MRRPRPWQGPIWLPLLVPWLLLKNTIHAVALLFDVVIIIMIIVIVSMQQIIRIIVHYQWIVVFRQVVIGCIIQGRLW